MRCQNTTIDNRGIRPSRGPSVNPSWLPANEPPSHRGGAIDLLGRAPDDLVDLRLSCRAVVATAGPPVLTLVVGAILSVELGVLVARPLSAAPRRHWPPPYPISSGATRPIFSVHVAIHDAPPQVFAATPAALARQTWSPSDHEIIVIDNNTANPALWQLVERLRTKLRPQFRFVHVMHVRGAKAGTLNIALTMTRPDATHVVTVDGY